MSESSNIVRFFVGSDFSRFFFWGGGVGGGLSFLNISINGPLYRPKFNKW